MKLEFTEKDCLEAGVAEIIGREALEKGLASGRPLRIKLGIDPTSPNIHIGRSIPLWRLRAFQELGHEIHLIIGDFTGQIGDTSDKDAERPMLSEVTIQENLSSYMEQLWMILNPDRKDQVVVHYNSEWLNPLSLGKISALADAFSVNQFMKRELIQKRLESGSRVSLREMLYPLMQGYDSVMIEADVELGGTDQRFNLLAGRLLQEQAGQVPQSLIMNTIISGTDGRKMSSSWGNVIALRDTAEDKFGKMMSIRDESIAEYLEVLPLSVRPFTSTELQKRMEQGENPRDLKQLVARQVVALYHGEEVADATVEKFKSQFSNDQMPPEITDFQLAEMEINIVDALVRTELAPSKTEARRLIEQRGVRIDSVVVEDGVVVLILDSPKVVQVGKRKFIRLVHG
jgi:tyrosyl-tRNA synthetase